LPAKRRTVRPRKPKPAADAPENALDSNQRLQKVLASAGVGSRRQCEELILSGRVEVDGKLVTEMGAKADPRQQEIRVDGETLSKQRTVYYLVHKPPGVVSTNYDPSGRPRVIDLLPEARERLFTVGRLDMSSEGLMLVTNDGELANRLTHPRYGVEKTYQVLVAGAFTQNEAAALSKGVHLAEGPARASRVKVRSQKAHSTLLEVVLTEGRNREIRRLLAKVGHKVLKLKRIAIGPVRLADLPPGDHRRLTPDELRQLQQAAQPARKKKPRPAGAALDGPRAKPARSFATARTAARPARRPAAVQGRRP
jgi:23S rRNA pseudouridine2605 synthase